MSTFKWRVRELVKGFSNCCQQNPEVLQTAAALSVSIDKLRAYDPLRTKSFAAAFLERMKALETVLNDNLNRGFPLSPFEGVARRRNLALQHQSKALEHAVSLDRGYLTDTKSAGAVFRTEIGDLVGIQSGLAQTDDALDWAERYYRSDCDNQERYVAVREARAEVRAVLAEFHKEMRSSCPGLFEIVPPEKRE
jgi:hypothetical protein